jgi:hypothetical protein
LIAGRRIGDSHRKDSLIDENTQSACRMIVPSDKILWFTFLDCRMADDPAMMLSVRHADQRTTSDQDVTRAVVSVAERMTNKTHIYEVRPRRDKRGFDLISDALPFGRLCYFEVADAIGYAEFYSRAHDAEISRLR